MRACVLAIGMIALAQPAFARDFHKSSHHISKHHHHAAQARPHHRTARLVRVRREAPIISGYSMPQSFARTDAVDSQFTQQPWQPTESRAVSRGFAETPAARSIARAAPARNTALDAAIARHAAANGLPAELVHRVVIRESGYNPRASNAGNIGLMQIRHATARLWLPPATRAVRSRFMRAAITGAARRRGARRVRSSPMRPCRGARRSRRCRCATMR